MTGVPIRRGNLDAEIRGGNGIYKPRREASQGTDTAHTLIWDLQPPVGREYTAVVSVTQSVALCFRSQEEFSTWRLSSAFHPTLVGSFPVSPWWSGRRLRLGLLPHHRKEAETTTPTARGGLLFLVKGPGDPWTHLP